MNNLTNVTVKLYGSDLQVNFLDGSLAFWDEQNYMKLYNMAYLTFHAPSEHTFDGYNYDLEMQVVY